MSRPRLPRIPASRSPRSGDISPIPAPTRPSLRDIAAEFIVTRCGNGPPRFPARSVHSSPQPAGRNDRPDDGSGTNCHPTEGSNTMRKTIITVAIAAAALLGAAPAAFADTTANGGLLGGGLLGLPIGNLFGNQVPVGSPIGNQVGSVSGGSNTGTAVGSPIGGSGGYGWGGSTGDT